MHPLLSQIDSPQKLQTLSGAELLQLSEEVRQVLCNLVSTRSAHFASNLGVVELCIALHAEFDFLRDRLIWDTGHQIYPHKLVTGRYHEFGTMRMRGGLMGYPNPAESPYDLFMTGHAGCSLATLLGLRSGDHLCGDSDRHSVAVIGDGAFPSGIVFEAMNNVAAELKRPLLLILNDNKMSICPRVGGIGSYLDRLRTNTFYTGLKTEIVKTLNKVPLLGDPLERFLAQMKVAVKAGLQGGMLFEELGFRYIGPIDGHNIPLLRKYIRMAKKQSDPILLHVVTEKGHGFEPAAEDPVFFHTPPAFEDKNGKAVPKATGGKPAYTNIARDAIFAQMQSREDVTVMTAAMCQGTKMEPIREAFPSRFFDTGICESYTVAFAAGQAKAGLHPIVNIYSTFLQRSFDQIFQEVALQNLPVTFMLDRAGLTAPDGPTHHGLFDFGYMRIFPNMVVMAPGDAADLPPMLEFSLNLEGPSSLRYPKTEAEAIERSPAPIALGKAEIISEGEDGAIIACGTLLPRCIEAAALLAKEGVHVSVINARFVKPLDRETLLAEIREKPLVITVEEAALAGGFGSALLEAASDEGLSTAHLRRLGMPDQFVEHGDRNDLLASLGLDAVSIAREFLPSLVVPESPAANMPSL